MAPVRSRADGSNRDPSRDRRAASRQPPAAPAQPTGLAAVLGTGDHKVIGRLYIGSRPCLALVVGRRRRQPSRVERLDTSGSSILSERHRRPGPHAPQRRRHASCSLLPLIARHRHRGRAAPGRRADHRLPPGRGRRRSGPGSSAAASSSARYLINGGPGGGRADGVDLCIVAIGLVVARPRARRDLHRHHGPRPARRRACASTRVPLFSWSMLVASVHVARSPCRSCSARSSLHVRRPPLRPASTFGGNAELVRPRHLGLRATRRSTLLGHPGARLRRRRPRRHLPAPATPPAAWPWAPSAPSASSASARACSSAAYADVGSRAALRRRCRLARRPAGARCCSASWADLLRRGTLTLASPASASRSPRVLMLLLGVVAGAGRRDHRRSRRSSTPTWHARRRRQPTSSCCRRAHRRARRRCTGGPPRSSAVRPARRPGAWLALGSCWSAPSLLRHPRPRLGAGAGDGVADEDRRHRGARTSSSLVGLAHRRRSAPSVAVLIVAAADPQGDDDVPADPWGGQTLEWATSSPPPLGQLRRACPVVTSAAPLLDQREEASA